VPSASSVLRRSLFLWGTGHIALGDRRGWVLLLLQPLAIAAVLIIAAQLIDGTRWLIVFPPLGALLAVWLAQALSAYRLAVAKGAAPTGELQAAMFLPVAVAILTVFWLVGGRHGTPAATLESYALAWMNRQPAAGAALYVAPPATEALADEWTAEEAYLAARLAELAQQFGPQSGLDPDRPFDSIRFAEPVATGDGQQTVVLDIVRRQRVETMFLGTVPTATQETVVVERAGTLVLELVSDSPPDWLPFAWFDSFAWRISEVVVGPS
jgi:hypothetical protein